MSYPKLAEFDQIFIRNTLSNLARDHEFEFTQLVNSLLGLIVLPRQCLIKNIRCVESFGLLLCSFPELEFLSGTCSYRDEGDNLIEEQKFILADEPQPLSRMTLRMLTDNLRHSIAHQSIRPTKDGLDWEGILFRNYPKKVNEADAGAWKSGWIFQVYLTKEEIRELCNLITGKYLEGI